MQDAFDKNKAQKVRRAAGLALMYLFMTVLAVVLLFPYMFMLLRSLMLDSQVMLYPVELWPEPFSFKAYIDLFTANNYFRYFLQTAKVVVFNLIAIPLSASFVAYGFSKYWFRGKRFFFSLMMATMMLPGVVVQIPQYVLFNDFGWLDSLLPLTIPNLFGGGAIYVFLIRQYMIGIPKELEEAAIIDGAGILTTFARVIIPVSKPILATIAVFSVVAEWNYWFDTHIYIVDEELFTLQYVLYDLMQDAQRISEQLARRMNGPTISTVTVRMTITFVVTVPILLVYPFMQRYFTKGLMLRAVKG